jgi:hypothetical protein
MSGAKFAHVEVHMITAEVLQGRAPEILISLRVFHSAPVPTTVRIIVNGNAPIDWPQYQVAAE